MPKWYRKWVATIQQQVAMKKVENINYNKRIRCLLKTRMKLGKKCLASNRVAMDSNRQQKNFFNKKILIFNLEQFIFCIPIDPMIFYILYSLYSKKVAMIQQQLAMKKVENIDYNERIRCLLKTRMKLGKKCLASNRVAMDSNRQQKKFFNKKF